MSVANHKTAGYDGFHRSDAITLTIANGNTETTTHADFGRNVAYVEIQCDDGTGIAAATTMGALVSYDDTDQFTNLWELDGAQVWASGNLPTDTTSFGFLLRHAFGAQRLHLSLSNATTGDVTFRVFGMVASVSQSTEQ